MVVAGARLAPGRRLDDGDVVLHTPPGAGPNWLFIAVPDDKVSRTASTSTSGPTISRPRSTGSLALGARHVDIGQGDESWVVLADPEGNEFCILAPND